MFEKNIEEEISVVISTFDDPINFVEQCLSSLLAQEHIFEIIIVDSSKTNDIKNLCSKMKKSKINYIFTPPKGLSDARNIGMANVKKNIVAFTDSDCIVDKNWADNILLSFNKSLEIAIVGGKIIPRWISKPSKILSKSGIAQGFYSLYDMGDKEAEVDQIYGANFAINKSLITMSFLTELGRKDKNSLLSGEETMLCRYIKKNDLKIIYNPLAVVSHQIPEKRSSYKWMLNRMYYGGVSRAIVGGKPTPKEVNISYNFYDLIFLIIFIIPYLYGLFNGLLNGLFKTEIREKQTEIREN